MGKGIFIIVGAILLLAIVYLASKGYFNLEKADEVQRKGLENNAKNFAKLLILEIKLYENYKIEKGLQNNNLYESLRDEIETAREKYKKKVPQEELNQYFEDALVEVLAGGDRSKLGLS